MSAPPPEAGVRFLLLGSKKMEAASVIIISDRVELSEFFLVFFSIVD